MAYKRIRRLWLRGPRLRRRTEGARRGRRGYPHLWLVSAVIGVGLALLAIHSFDARLRPLVSDMAQAKIKNEVTAIIDCAVHETLATEAVAYDDMVTLQKDASGRITAMTTSSPKMNALRTEILEDVLEQVKLLYTSDLGIPLGDLTGLVTASNRGPLLPVRILAVASPTASFQNAFTAAGINQTLHQVMLDISVTVKLLIPGGTLETDISTQVCVAETVIVGEVPDTYLQFQPTSQLRQQG